MPGTGSRRDPVSMTFDAAARRLLDRAYASPGTWVQVWLPDPSIRQRTRWAAKGIVVDRADNGGSAVGGSDGGSDAKTRWARGFIRAINYQHKWYSPGREKGWRAKRRTSPRSTGGLRWEVGRHVPPSPQFDPANPSAGGLPPRRRVRVQLAAGGAEKERAVARLSDRDRIWTRDGQPAGRFSDPSLRDWA